MIIKNADILCNDFKFKKGDISFGERITEISDSVCGDEVFDAEDCYVIPGLIDTHIHSCMGRTIAEGTQEAFDVMSECQAKHGTTSLCMTLSCMSKQFTIDTAKGYAKAIKNGGKYARYVGMHFEGPFFAKAATGAAKEGAASTPNTEELMEYIEAAEDNIRIMTAAPEAENIECIIPLAKQHNISLSAGHTQADFETAKKAFALGFERATHTFNAMTGLHHRNPGVVGAIMDTPDVEAELICDFFHVDPAVVKIFFAVKGADKITMVSDAEVGAGMPDGRYYGSSERYLNVKNGRTYTDDGIICGGTSFLIDGVRNLVSIGIPIEDAVKTASLNPARAVKRENDLGSLAVGKYADILVLDKALDIVKVFIGGREMAL